MYITNETRMLLHLLGATRVLNLGGEVRVDYGKDRYTIHNDRELALHVSSWFMAPSGYGHYRSFVEFGR